MSAGGAKVDQSRTVRRSVRHRRSRRSHRRSAAARLLDMILGNPSWLAAVSRDRSPVANACEHGNIRRIASVPLLVPIGKRTYPS